MKTNKKNIPFEFVFDHLAPLDVTIKPMFGFFALYIDEKIILVLRQRKESPSKNGVWIATTIQHHESLKKDLPSMRSISKNHADPTETEWQVIPFDADDFESSVIKACEFIKRGDPRIGRIPKPGKPKQEKSQAAKKSN